MFTCRVYLEIARKVVDANIEGDGIQSRDDQFEDVTGEYENPELRPNGGIRFDGQRGGVEVGDGNDRKRIDELADHGRAVVAQPEMFAACDFFPEMEEINIAELGGEIGTHGGQNGPHCEHSDFVEGVGIIGFCGEARFRVHRGHGRQFTAKPKNEDDPEVKDDTHQNDKVGASSSVEFGDKVRAQEGDGVREYTDGHRQCNITPLSPVHVTLRIPTDEGDELGHTQNVEHRHRSQENPGKNQKNAFTPLMEFRVDVCVRKALRHVKKEVKCGREDSNLHGLPHWNLNPARLPIPPRPLC